MNATSIYIDKLTRLSSLDPPVCHIVASGANDVSVVVAGDWPATGGLLPAKKESRDEMIK